jgi:hypothetical protein
VLGAALVPPVAQPLAGANLNRLDLEAIALGQDGIGTPRTFGMLDHRTILPDWGRDGIT